MEDPIQRRIKLAVAELAVKRFGPALEDEIDIDRQLIFPRPFPEVLPAPTFESIPHNGLPNIPRKRPSTTDLRQLIGLEVHHEPSTWMNCLTLGTKLIKVTLAAK